MQTKDTSVGPSMGLRIEFTEKPVSGWGGLVLFLRFVDRCGVREWLARALPDGRTSPNQIPVTDIALAFLTTVLTGGQRFAHVERLRGDETIRALLGMGRMPSAMTLTRYFGGFVQSQVARMTDVLWEFLAERLPVLTEVLDLDSSVFERYGEQEGSLKGHNPRRHGRPSHHPLFAFLAESRLVLHAWLRSGNTGSERGATAFLAEVFAKLPTQFTLRALRADSGFFVKEFLEELERRALPYVIVARMTHPVKRAIRSIEKWERLDEGLAISETQYQAPTWPSARRLVVVRQELKARPDARGRRLIEVPGYAFHSFVTTYAGTPREVWDFYRGRADCENRLKELKEDFNLDCFCLQSFRGTEVAFQLGCFLFNLVALFKRSVTQDPRPRLSTLRTSLFVVGAILGARGHQRVLRLGLRARRREAFTTLLARTDPTVAQLTEPRDKAATDKEIPPTPRWRPRRSRTRVPLGPYWLPPGAAPAASN